MIAIATKLWEEKVKQNKKKNIHELKTGNVCSSFQQIVQHKVLSSCDENFTVINNNKQGHT